MTRRSISHARRVRPSQKEKLGRRATEPYRNDSHKRKTTVVICKKKEREHEQERRFLLPGHSRLCCVDLVTGSGVSPRSERGRAGHNHLGGQRRSVGGSSHDRQLWRRCL